MTQYRRGTTVEYWCRNQLHEDGFGLVIRSAGSKGPFDLVAIGENAIKLIQVKRVGGGKVPSFAEELAAMREVPAPPCVSKELWIFVDERKTWTILPV